MKDLILGLNERQWLTVTFEFSHPMYKLKAFKYWSSVGTVVRALAFHQCGPGSIPGSDVIRVLSLLVLYSAPRGFPPVTPVFPSHQKPTFYFV